MPGRSPESIARWLDGNLFRFDGPQQFLGTEPNAARRPWDAAGARWLLAASWDYSQAAGNMAIPAVYDAIHKAETYCLADRWYLPATPRDMDLLERGQVPAFGIESRHQALDFDVVATSISYTVLFMNFCKLLSLSGIPLRWEDRQARSWDYPMVMAGGQAYCAPEFMAPVVDCVWLGEAEEEPGNPGIAAVCARIAVFKQSGLWLVDREECYAQLAREFSFLYFPRFTAVSYRYEDRGLPELTKMVDGFSSRLPGIGTTFKVRRVANLDNADLMTSAPVLFADPGMGCPSADSIVLTAEGPRRAGSLMADQVADPHPLLVSVGAKGLHSVGALLPKQPRAGCVEVHTRSGHVFRGTADHLIQVVEGPLENVQGRRSRRTPLRDRQFDQTRDSHATCDGLARVWVEAADLNSRHLVPVYYGQNLWSSELVRLRTDYTYPRDAGSGRFQAAEVALPEHLDAELAYFLGLFVSDGTLTVLESGSARVGIYVADSQPGLLAEVRRLFSALFPGGTVREEACGGETGRGCRVYVCSKAVGWWLSENFGVTDLETRRARVFPEILRSPREVVTAFLSGVFDANGSCPYAGSEQRYQGPTFVGRFRGFAEDVVSLLLNLGAPASLNSYSARWSWGGGSAVMHEMYKVSIVSALDGDYQWLRPRLAYKAEAVRAWEAQAASRVRPGCMYRDGVFYSPVKEVRRLVDAEECADIQVPGISSFTCGGMVIHNSGDVEVARGCPDWCSFCRLSWVTKPYRQESVPRSLARAGAWRDNMGSTEISLVAPDPPMHSQMKKLVAGLLEDVAGKVDASSMRIDDYISDPDFSLLLQVSGITSLTLGLEGNSQRMRDLAGKGTSDDDVAKAVATAIRAGIRKIKLYFITNWPGEDQTDVMRIVELGKRLADIRDSFGPAAAGVQVIFSWTPLLIEAQTPLQWFEVTPPDYMLQQALDELREHRIWIKIGSKASPPKLAFFQACQRASRDAGEAITDVIENYGTASWGGFPKDMREKLDEAMKVHGFRNGLDDIFGERFYEDLLGWEMIDTGVKRSLMWRVYRDMVELLEGTDAETYDADIPEGYHGNEWVPRCDQQCSGTACGVCDRDDLELRRKYVQAVDRDLKAEPVRPLDQSTVAQRVRLRVERLEAFRFVTGTFLEYAIRRAAYRAHRDGFPALAAESVRLVSAGTGYRERSAGVDYAEFGLTAPADGDAVGEFLARMAVHMHPHLHWSGNYAVLPAAAKLPARPVGLWELEVADDPAVLARWLRRWDEAEAVPVLIRADSFYAGATAEPGDAKGHVTDFWLTRDGQRTVLRMLLKGRLGPYQAYAALAGKASWLEAARYTARRLEFFSGGAQPCEGCGLPVPASLLDVPWSERFCPRCGDEAEGTVTAALTVAGVLQVPALHTCGGTCGQPWIQQDAPVRPAVRHEPGHQRRGMGRQGLRRGPCS